MPRSPETVSAAASSRASPSYRPPSWNTWKNHNADPKPFIWTKSAGEILEKVARAKQARLVMFQPCTVSVARLPDDGQDRDGAQAIEEAERLLCSRSARTPFPAMPPRSDAGPPGPRSRSFCTCGGLRPRQVGRALAMTRQVVLPSAPFSGVGTRAKKTIAAQWRAYAQRSLFAQRLAERDAAIDATSP